MAIKSQKHVQEQERQGLEEFAGKYLTFKLAEEEYGLEILKVQEIIKVMDITHVPRNPPTIKGVINLRGKVIPIIDLRLSFSMEEAEETEKTCIIVVQVGDGKIIMGIVVDEVSEVLDVKGSEIEPPPLMGAAVNTAFILGMAKAKGSVIILLDTDKVLNVDELNAVEKEMRV